MRVYVRVSARPACIKYYWYGHPQKNPLGRVILLLRHVRKYNVGTTEEEDYRKYTGTKSGNPPPPSILTDEEDYHHTYTGTKSGNPPRPF